MLKTIIALLSSCVFFSGAVFAEEAAQVKEDAPDRYVVVKGDTLWAISGKFLKDPWRWPEIWKLNKEEIKNPHLIYPGDVVVLDRVNGELRLVKNAKYQGRDFEKRSPQTRVEPTERAAIPVISPADIGPFLSQPLVIEKDGLESAPRILANEENRVVIGSGNRAYVEGLKEGGPKQWHIFRPGKALIDPDTQAILGYEAIYLGDARVLKYGEAATIEIIKSVQEILRDDRLLPRPLLSSANIVPHAPSKGCAAASSHLMAASLKAGAARLFPSIAAPRMAWKQGMCSRSIDSARKSPCLRKTRKVLLLILCVTSACAKAPKLLSTKLTIATKHTVLAQRGMCQKASVRLTRR